MAVTASKTAWEAFIYIDDVDKSPVPNDISSDNDFATSGQNFYTGSQNDGGGPTDGYFAEIMIFGAVLTPSELSEIYTNTCGYYASLNNIKGMFDENYVADMPTPQEESEYKWIVPAEVWGDKWNLNKP